MEVGFEGWVVTGGGILGTGVPVVAGFTGVCGLDTGGGIVVVVLLGGFVLPPDTLPSPISNNSSLVGL